MKRSQNSDHERGQRYRYTAIGVSAPRTQREKEEFNEILDDMANEGWRYVESTAQADATHNMMLVFEKTCRTTAGRDDDSSTKLSWDEARERVIGFAHGEARALTPMADEMVVLYDEGNYGPTDRDSPPNVELITKASSIWDTRTDDGSFSFRELIEKYDISVLEEVDLTETSSDAQSKAYVGVPKHRIRLNDEGR